MRRMTIVRLVGLQVTDESSYAEYRRLMAPLLEREGGSFGVDVRVSEVLRPSGKRINRLFTLEFPDEAALDRFFGDEAYRAIREAHFAPAVAETHILGVLTATP